MAGKLVVRPFRGVTSCTEPFLPFPVWSFFTSGLSGENTELGLAPGKPQAQASSAITTEPV